MEQCDNCMYWDTSSAMVVGVIKGQEERGAQCRRFPGGVIIVPQPKRNFLNGDMKMEANFQTVLPYKAASEWCGEYAPKEA